MCKTTTTRGARRLAAAAVALGSCLALAGPAAGVGAAPADPVPTVFFGDSYTANIGIAPFNEDGERTFCFRAKENYPAVATRHLAEKSITLDVQAGVSCGGALIHHFWNEQELLAGSGLKVPAQQEALKADTQLVVGGLGGNSLGFNRILKQCSATLRDHALLPGTPVDTDEPAAKCAEFFASGDGKEWLDGRFEQVEYELEELLDRIGYFSPEAKRVLVGYPRLVPADTAKCRTAAPGQTELPFADIPQDALPFLDGVQKRLDDVMKKAVANAEVDADFVDLYDHTGSNTACDGADRGIRGLLENSQLAEGQIPWYAHPNTKGRDIQAEQVTAKIETILNR
ncbi:SGNH/GDSL hydrolase family protein [Streptomyces sp. NPDC101191]|uniref:SGNH/GDSL hydrolase family protein n=1 Tax=Streptomyces sp. NPDC101191 TaxID=3366126 RepID=UPI0037F75381